MRINLMFNSLLGGGLTDIDGNSYTTVTIGGQEWIVQNFKATKYSNNSPIQYVTSNPTWAADSSGAYCEYDNSVGRYKNTYGYLYNWFAVDKRYDDWFLPSKDELNKMYENLYLESVGEFSTYLYWSSSETVTGDAWSQHFEDGTQYSNAKSATRYVRACRSFTSSTPYSLRDIGPAGGLIFYIDGNTYYEASLVDQSISSVWSNILSIIGASAQGTAIGTGKTNTIAIITQVGHTTSAAYLCTSLRNPLISLAYFKRNGVYEAGWRIPSDVDWNTLYQFLGGDTSTGGKLKETGLSHWFTPNTGATNEYGFTSLPGGYRDTAGVYGNRTGYDYQWTSDACDNNTAWFRYMSYNNANLSRWNDDKNWGFSVRCVKDTQGTPVLSFFTEASTSTFSPSFGVSAGILVWNFGDASYNISGNSVLHNYSSTGRKNVKVFKGTTNGSSNITYVSLDYDNLIGTLDISSLSNITSLYVAYNPSLTNIIMPPSNKQIVTTMRADSCNLIGTIDISGFSNLGTNVNFSSNPKLNYILNPSSNQSFLGGGYQAYSCGLMGTLDLSGLTGLGGSIQFYGNPSLNKIINPKSSVVFSTYYAFSCDLIGTLDVSGLSGLGGSFIVYGNPKLNYILNPSSNQSFNSYSAYSCGLMETLDLRSLKRLSGYIKLNNNSSLNTILNPDSSATITNYEVYSCGLTGTLDVSGLTGLGGDFKVYSNKQLTAILNPSTNQAFTSYYAYDCSLKTLDLRPLKALGGDIRLNNNASLNNILFPDSSVAVTTLYVNSTDISVLDVSKMTGLGGTFWAYNNPKLTRIINPSSNVLFNAYLVYSTGLSGTLDISSLNRLGGALMLDNNPSLTSVIFPKSSEAIVVVANNSGLTGTFDVSSLIGLNNSFRVFNNASINTIVWPTLSYEIYDVKVQNCSLNTWSIDHILGRLNTWYSSHSPTTDLSANFTGAKMAKPGTDGSTAKYNIEQIFLGAGKVARIDVNI